MKILVTHLSAAVLSSVATVAFSQTNDTGKALVASNNLKISADAERSGESVGYHFIVPFAGVVRIRWEFRSDGSGATVRGGAGGLYDYCIVSTSEATYQQAVCDAHVMAGDLVGAGASNLASDPSRLAYIRRVRIYYNVVDNPGLGKTLLD